MDAHAAALKLLLVGCQPDDVALVLEELRRGGYRVELQCVTDEVALRVALGETSWDLVVTDTAAAPFTLTDALAAVRQHDEAVPIVVLTKDACEAVIVNALRAGAQDVVVKSRMHRLCAVIETELPAAVQRRKLNEVRGSLHDIESQLMMSDRLVQIGMLAAGIAHEINNPLACVLANIELAAGDLARLRPGLDIDPVIIEEVRDAHEAAKRVRDIVQDIRVFSRGNDETHGIVSVRDVLESSLRLAWNEIRHRAKVVRDYHDVPPVRANEARLGQVFLNLLVNAAQALPEGRAGEHEIRLSTRSTDGKVIVTVADTGPGISEAVLPRLFLPFVTTKPVGVGTGLGLSISRRILRHLGGELRARNVPGAGAAFDVVLPAARGESLRHTTAPPPSSTPGRCGRILLVDDDPMVGRIVDRVLSDRHDVEAVSSAAEALARISRGDTYDVILCDLMMPEMTGMDFYDALADMAPSQRSVVVFMTGGAFTPAAHAFLERVPNPRVEKPFSAQALRTLVEGRLQ